MIKNAFKNLPLILALIAFAGSSVRAESLEEIPNPRLRDNTWVTDLSGKLQPETITQANSLISELERERSAEIALVIINSLDGQEERQLATDLLRRWGVGKQALNNGLLFLWVVNDRRVVVEVGYGLEPILPDGKVGSILDRYVVPYFKNGEFDRGIIEGLGAFASVIRSEPIDLPPVTSQSYTRDSPDRGDLLILWLLAILPIGAASIIGYRLWWRYHTRTCSECQVSMLRIDEKEDDELLQEPMQVEERLGSVNYDVWRCPECRNHLTLRYPKWFAGHSKCPQCSYRTCSKKESILRAATTTGEGLSQVTEKCEYCNYKHVYRKTIPRISTSNSSSSGSSWSGGSGSSGFSGGGSGGGSFGGGSSGGGGASRGY